MDIRTLKYFLAVANEENITKAAELLHISQPSLSKQLHDLEDEYGKKFFNRGKRKTTLTEDGMLLKQHAEEILALFSKTEQLLLAEANLCQGSIAIGGTTSTTVSKVISEMYNDYPKITFDFYNAEASTILEKIDNGILDFGILLAPIDITKYDYLELHDMDCWGFFMHKSLPIASKGFIEPGDISSLPIVIHQGLELKRKLALWSATDLSQLNIIANYNLFFNTPVELVKKGMGCAFVSKQSISCYQDDSMCFCPIRPQEPIKLNLVWRSKKVLPSAAQTFLQRVRAEIRSQS